MFTGKPAPAVAPVQYYKTPETARVGWGSPQLFVSQAHPQKSRGKSQPAFAV